jgi:hypothetical protein
MRAIYLAPALLLTALAVSPASAAPAAVVDGVTSPIVLAQVYHRGGDNDRRYDRDHRRAPPRYVAGRRYGSAPHGWHRYDRRPGDWRHRGCVLVGPVWFCP